MTLHLLMHQDRMWNGGMCVSVCVYVRECVLMH